MERTEVHAPWIGEATPMHPLTLVVRSVITLRRCLPTLSTTNQVRHVLQVQRVTLTRN